MTCRARWAEGSTCCLQLAGVHDGSGAAVNPKHLFPVRSVVYLWQETNGPNHHELNAKLESVHGLKQPRRWHSREMTALIREGAVATR
jgi:hypothetical protein